MTTPIPLTERTTEDLVTVGRATMSLGYNPQPIVLSHGEGTRIWDRDGKEYLDFLAGIAVSALGHGHPRLVAAIQAQAASLLHVSNAYFNEPQILLQERLANLCFANRVFFCNSGAEANEAAIKLARRYQRHVKQTPRFEVITFDGSFHGRTYGAISATAQPKYHAGFEPMVPGFVYSKFGDLDGTSALVGPHTAAILVEPVQGEGGVRPATAEFLRGLRELCDGEGLVLIFDEVQTGVGRCGEWFAHQHYGVEPDIMALAKGIGGGVPLGAMVARADVATGFGRGSHATTFGGNPLATRAGLAVLDTIEADGLLANARAMGERLRAGLASLADAHPSVREVRGLGLLNGVVLHGSADDAARVVAGARGRGLLLNTAGGTVLRLVPPLTVSAAEVDRAIAVLDESLGDVG